MYSVEDALLSYDKQPCTSKNKQYDKVHFIVLNSVYVHFDIMFFFIIVCSFCHKIHEIFNNENSPPETVVTDYSGYSLTHLERHTTLNQV